MRNFKDWFNKKNIRVLFTSVLLIILICSVVYGKSIFFNSITNDKIPELFLPQAGQEMPENIQYDVNVSLDENSSEKMVYEFCSPIDPENEAKNIARALNMPEPQYNIDFDALFSKYEEKKQLKKGNKTELGNELASSFLYQPDTGVWEYSNSILESACIGANLPSDEDAINIVKKYLKDKNIIFPEYLTKISISESKYGDAFNLKVKYKSVNFEPDIKNMNILCAYNSVDVGDNGNILAIRYHHKKFKEYKKFKTISSKKAFDKLKKGVGSINIPQDTSKAKIESLEIGYYQDLGRLKEQKYLHPVWIFKGKAKIQVTGSEENFDAIIAAIDYE